MTGAPTMTATILSLALIERRLGEVTASLNEATGGAALCRIDGTGGSAKSFEGRMAALLEVRRSLRKDPDAGVTAASALVERWRSDLQQRSARGASAAWQEYLAGGVTELEHLLGPDDAGSSDPQAPAEA
jgi:hypothetical protein